MFHYGSKLGAKRAEVVQLMQKFVPLSHIRMFRYDSKLGAKQAEVVQLMQKFVPWSHIGMFHNKRTRSTPIGS